MGESVGPVVQELEGVVVDHVEETPKLDPGVEGGVPGDVPEQGGHLGAHHQRPEVEKGENVEDDLSRETPEMTVVVVQTVPPQVGMLCADTICMCNFEGGKLRLSEFLFGTSPNDF